MAEILLANHQAGTHIIPALRKKGDAAKPPIIIEPGCVQPIDSKHWDAIKDHPAIKYKLDHGILSVVKKADQNVVVGALETSEPVIPPHLQDEEQEGTMTKAKVKKEKPGTLDVSGDE